MCLAATVAGELISGSAVSATQIAVSNGVGAKEVKVKKAKDD